MASPRARGSAPMPAQLDPPLFYMYEGRELDFGWMRHCPAFDSMRSSPFNERLAEVEMRELLSRSRWRTRDPAKALLFYVPIWEVVSFKLGSCNGTTHAGRINAAFLALMNAPTFRPRHGRKAGHDHFFATTGCIEDNQKLASRLGPSFTQELAHTIVGRDRAYSPLYVASGIGRCTIEIPYVSNPHATRIAMLRQAYSRSAREHAHDGPEAVLRDYRGFHQTQGLSQRAIRSVDGFREQDHIGTPIDHENTPSRMLSQTTQMHEMREVRHRQHGHQSDHANGTSGLNGMGHRIQHGQRVMHMNRTFGLARIGEGRQHNERAVQVNKTFGLDEIGQKGQHGKRPARVNGTAGLAETGQRRQHGERAAHANRTSALSGMSILDMLLSETTNWSLVGLSDTQTADLIVSSGEALDAALEDVPTERPAKRRWLLSFQGSMHAGDMCCKLGRSIRSAAAKLMGSSPDVRVSDVPRNISRGELRGDLWGHLYEAQAALMSQSTFCLVPHGDTEVTSRLYTAIASGCIPVVIADRLSGAFASLIPYREIWLQVEQGAFISNPFELIRRLRKVSQAQIARRRELMLRHAADVLYDWPHSRVGDNFLRAASYGCMARTVDTRELGTVIYPDDGKANPDREAVQRFGTECTCVKRPNSYWWVSKGFAFNQDWRGRWPTEICRCLHCSKLCVNADLALPGGVE